MSNRSWSVVLLVVLLPACAGARHSPRPGDTVRVRTSDATSELLELAALGPGRLVGRMSGRDTVLVLHPSTLVEIRSIRRFSPEGALLGAFVGGLVGYRGDKGADFILSEVNRAGDTIIGGLFGAMVGALLGHALKTEVWLPTSYAGPDNALDPGKHRPRPFLRSHVGRVR